jgi:hypothetical protein
MQRQTSECLRVVAAPGRGFICLGATAAHNTDLRLATGTGRRAAAAVPWTNDAGQQTECPFWIMRRVGRARWLCQAECFRQVSAKTSGEGQRWLVGSSTGLTWTLVGRLANPTCIRHDRAPALEA